MTLKAHLPSWRNVAERPTIIALVILSVVSARVDALYPMFDLDSSWAIGLNHAATHGVRFGHDLVFTYGPLIYLTIPLSLYRMPLFLGLLWAVGVGAAMQTALWVLTRHLASRDMRLLLGVAAALPLGYIWRPEIALLTFALWILVLLDLEALQGPHADTWIGVLGALSAAMLLSKFSLSLAFVMLVTVCMVGPRVGRHLFVAGASFVGAFVVLWLVTGQRIGDIVDWFRLSLDVSFGYNSEMANHYLDDLSGFRIFGLLAGAVALLVFVVWQPLLTWWNARTRQNAAALVVIGMLFYFFLKQSFVRFDAMHAPAVFGALCILSIAVLPHQRTPTWMTVFPIAVVLGTLSQSLPPVRGVDTWYVVRNRIESVKQLADGMHQVVSPAYHRQKALGDWQRVVGLGIIPVDVIRARIGDTPVAVEPAHISAAFAMGLNWRPMFTLQAYSAYNPDFDERNAAQLTAPDAPEFILARYSIIDSRNQLWTSPRYQLTIACNYQLDTDLNPWMIFRKAPNRCGTPTQIEQVTVTKNQVIQTPRRPNSIIYATFHYDTGILDRLSTMVLRPLITPRVRIDTERRRIVNGLMGQPHIMSQPRRIGGLPTPWGGITYKNLEFLTIPGPITVTYYEVPLITR